ncbi:formyltransferase family protein, partial [Azospirillum humicireducens]
MAGKPIPYIPGDRREDKKILQTLKDFQIDALLSIQYSWVLSGEILEEVRGRAYNLHNAKLPDYRGHHSLSHEILNGEKFHSVTIHRMDAIVDRGSLIFEETIAIRPDETARSLGESSLSASMILLRRFCQALASGKLPEKRLTDGGKFYSRHLLEQMREIKSPASLEEISRKARAFH